MSYLGIPRRNQYLNEAVEHFDSFLVRAQGDPKVAWSLLNKPEVDFIFDEIERCCTDARYYLENWHVVMTEQEGLKTLYPFWDSQEIFYNLVVDIQKQERPVKLVVLKARQLGSCLDPNTRVLTADLRWVPIGDVHQGDRLVSVDEGETLEEAQERWRNHNKIYKSGQKPPHKETRNGARKLRVAVVEARNEVHKPAFRLTMDNGERLIATAEHRFLFKKRGGVETIWRPVEFATVGDEIRFVVHPWKLRMAHEDGWFAGMLDGEGSARAKVGGGSEVCVSQVDGPVLKRLRGYLTENEYKFREEIDDRRGGDTSKFGDKPVHKLVLNSLNQNFRLIGLTRPERFTDTSSWWMGKELPGKGGSETVEPWSKIVHIDPLKPQAMIDLQTSEKTFIAEGFVSHNSTLSEGLIFHKTIFNKGVNALIVAQDPSQADFLFSMSRLAYDSLPWWMRPEERYQAKGRYLILDKRDDMERQRRPGMKSQILVEAANKMTSAGRGKTIRCAHFSELASWEDGGVLSRSLLPTMNATDELAIMESTAEGRIGFWFEWWRQVANGDVVDWTPLFIPYYRVRKYSKPIPEGVTFALTREEANIREKTLTKENYRISDEVFNWVRAKKREFVALEGDEFGFYQEFPINDVEAFQSSGTCAYPKRLLHHILDSDCCPPRWFGEIEYHHQAQSRKDGCIKLVDPVLHKAGQLHRMLKGEHLPPAREYGERLRVWELPESSSDYYVGADVAMGDGGDFSCAQVFRIGEGPDPDAQAAEWRGWISPTDFAHVLAALGYWYNEAQIACEANDVGVSTNNELFRIIEYPNIYRWKHVDKIKNFITDLFGWWTNHKTRDLIISKMREAIMERTLILRSEDLIDEMMAFTREEVGGRYEGRGTPDDRVMAANITNYCAHDSDYGMESMGKDRKAVMSSDTYFIFDELNRLRFQADREKAEMYVRSHPGWSMTTQPATKDYANTDFSPIFDKPGIRQELYEQGVPAEKIMGDLLLWADMEKGPRPMQDGDELDWRAW